MASLISYCMGQKGDLLSKMRSAAQEETTLCSKLERARQCFDDAKKNSDDFRRSTPTDHLETFDKIEEIYIDSLKGSVVYLQTALNSLRREIASLKRDWEAIGAQIEMLQTE